MPEVLDLLLSWIATTAACFYVVMRDERRLATSGLPVPEGGYADLALLAAGQVILWEGLFVAIASASDEPETRLEPWVRVALLMSFMALGLTLTPVAVLVTRHDQRRVTPDLVERAWPPASRAAAIIAFGQLAVWVHFWKTRKFGVRGFALGFFWAVAVSLPALAIGFLLDLIFRAS